LLGYTHEDSKLLLRKTAGHAKHRARLLAAVLLRKSIEVSVGEIGKVAPARIRQPAFGKGL
jgi:hypothetical protein